MATYAQQSDFEKYVEGWVTSDSTTLERLLERAEIDIDRLLIRPPLLTNIIEGISLSGSITGGTFELNQTWNSVVYTTPPIPWNTDGPALLTYLQNMADQYGRAITTLYPGDTVWQVPEQTYYSQPWAYGPLPNVPIVIEAFNQLGAQNISPLVATSNLQGTNPGIDVTLLVRGGLKMNKYLLSGEDAEKLTRATCAQAEYRNTMGEDFFRRAQWKNVSGPDFKTEGKLPRYGPKVFEELSGSDLLQRGARARPGTFVGRQIVYSPVGGLPIPDDWRAP